MAAFHDYRFKGLTGGPATEATLRTSDTDALFQEELTTICDDEDEVYDLGFIVEEHDDRRGRLLPHWQRLETLDSDEALETDPRGTLPEEALSLRRSGVPSAWRPAVLSMEYADAERNEQEFAESTGLVVDPAVYRPKSAARRGGRKVYVLDRNLAHGVGLDGCVNGIAPGFGTSVPQDIGAGGFAVADHPVLGTIRTRKT
jgi:hypothetical protein